MEIIVDDLTGPEIAEFIEEHIEEMKAVALSPESKHALDLDGLRVPEITFWTMIEDGEILGCGAIKLLGHDHAEIKSMRVDDRFRGAGVGRAILRHIIHDARERGLSSLWLETGSTDDFAPARRLYESEGFTECGPFDGYAEDPLSTFMTRSL